MSRVLIVDDDPISLHFLASAVAALGTDVTSASDAASALRAARTRRFDLLLLDRNLPDGSGSSLLADLRALGIAAPAIATSAEVDAHLATASHADGFVGVLEKPATLERIRTLLTPYLGAAKCSAILDDAAALSASGATGTVHALRELLARELTELEGELTRNHAIANPRTLSDRLHRLRAACGFCGAVALAMAAAQLQRDLDNGLSTSPDAFVQVCRETLRALRG